MGIILEYEEGKIFAGNRISGNRIGSTSGDITEEVIPMVFQHIVDMKTDSDNPQELELENPVRKHGYKPFKVTIKIEPID